MLELFPEGSFKITIPVLKAIEENGDIYITGLGGDTEPDNQGERLTEECIEDMKRQVQEGHIPLLRGHWNAAGKVITTGEWDDEIGQVVDILVTPQGQMFPKILIDMDMPLGRSLVKKIQRGKALGLSYGGKPDQWHTEFLPDGRAVRTFDIMKLWHFVPTTKPQYSRNLNRPLEIVAKSIPSGEWDKAARIEVDSIDHAYSDETKVLAILKSYREECGNSDGETKLKAEKWFQNHGVETEGDLKDSDYAWLSFAYQKMSPEERASADKSANRKLPYKVNGKVFEDGWRAAWNAAHGARGGTDFAGGPSQEMVINKLLADKPASIEVTKSEGEDAVSVDGIMLDPIEHEAAYAVVKSANPEIFEKRGTSSMELTQELLMELINGKASKLVDEKLDSALKSFRTEMDGNFKTLTDGMTELTAALKSMKDDAGGDDAKPALKAEDVTKLVDDAMKEKVGEMAKAALKSRKEGDDPADDKKGKLEKEEAQFVEDVVACLKGEKTFEDFKDKGEKYVAALETEAEFTTSEIYHNMAGTDPKKVESR